MTKPKKQQKEAEKPLALATGSCEQCGKTFDKKQYPKLQVALSKTGKILCKDCAEALPHDQILRWL